MSIVWSDFHAFPLSACRELLETVDCIELSKSKVKESLQVSNLEHALHLFSQVVNASTVVKHAKVDKRMHKKLKYIAVISRRYSFSAKETDYADFFKYMAKYPNALFNLTLDELGNLFTLYYLL